MRTLLLLLLPALLGAQPLSWEGYKVTPKKIGIWSACGVSGALWGGREALHADPYVFERNFGAGKTSFFGSQQWKRQYYGNDPDRPHRPNILNPVRDYWHFSGFSSRAIMLGAVFTIGVGKQPLRHKLADAAICTGVSAVSGWATYRILRR